MKHRFQILSVDMSRKKIVNNEAYMLIQVTFLEYELAETPFDREHVR